MASNLTVMASNLRAMASNLRAMASNLRALASKLRGMDGLQPKRDGLQPKSDSLQPKSDGRKSVRREFVGCPRLKMLLSIRDFGRRVLPGQLFLYLLVKATHRSGVVSDIYECLAIFSGTEIFAAQRFEGALAR